MVRGGGGAGKGGGFRGASTDKDPIGRKRFTQGRMGAGGGEDRNAELDGYDEEMLRDFEEYSVTLKEFWQNFEGNDGQMTIVENHIIPVSFEHVGHAEEQWPYSSDPDEYLDALSQCYYEDVLERAFSDAFQEIYDSLSEYWLHAEGVQVEHDTLLGHSAVHSTNPPWTA